MEVRNCLLIALDGGLPVMDGGMPGMDGCMLGQYDMPWLQNDVMPDMCCD